MSKNIYIESLKLKNIRTIEDGELKLTDENGNVSRWTLILGDNGIGKSTLLHSIAWMKPYFPDLRSDAGDEIAIEDVETGINNEENETLASLVRRSGKRELEAEIKVNFKTQNGFGAEVKTAQQFECSSETWIKLRNRKFEDFKTTVETNGEASEKFFYNNEIQIIAYSASRELGTQNLHDSSLEDTLQYFSEDATELYDAEEILQTIKYAGLDAKERGGPTGADYVKFGEFFQSVKDMLVAVLPDFENVEDIDVAAPKLDGQQVIPGDLLITTKHGKKIPFRDFSLGYKSVVSWTLDLAWRLFNNNAGKAPLKKPAIVLIDEIDLHLHPVWQRQIMQKLSKCFPAVQFIATAHSPLMVQAAVDSNYAVLVHNKDTKLTRIENNPEKISGWRIGQILTTIFGIESERSPEITDLQNERRDLLDKSSRDKKEDARLAELDKELSDLPVLEGDNQKLLDQIQKLTQKLGGGNDSN